MASVYRRKYWVTTAAGKRERRTQPHYTIDVKDPATGKLRHFRGLTDKKASVQEAARIEKELARGSVGLVDPFKEHRGRPLLDHVAEYVADLRGMGRDAKYIDNVDRRLRLLAGECDWAVLGDVEPNSFARWRERRKGVSWRGTATTEGRSGTSATTLNQFLETVQSFMNWCASKGRVPGVPYGRRTISPAMAGVGKVKGAKVRLRRALSDDEVTRLLATAPEERAMVYRVGISTGLRREELESLVWGDVRLNAIRPFIQLRAEATKANRADKVYLPASLADDLRKRRGAETPDGSKVFQVVPWLRTWKRDLAEAAIPWKDGMGRQADFHGGTRKTLCSRMHRAGVPLAVAMRAMRHTDARLTMVDYTDDEQIGMEQAVLPELTAKPVVGQDTQAVLGA